MSEFEFPQPLRLAVGSHEAGSGKGCAMNVVSYENGDTTITDYPACADQLLASVVQNVNDTHCTHRGPGRDLLCPPCSVEVLDLAHRTVGTGTRWTDRRGRTAALRAWVQIAHTQASRIERTEADNEMLAAVADWLAGRSYLSLHRYARREDPSSVAWLTVKAAVMAGVGERTASNIVIAVIRNVNLSTGIGLGLAHQMIDEFTRLTGIATTPVPQPDVVATAVSRMLEVHA